MRSVSRIRTSGRFHHTGALMSDSDLTTLIAKHFPPVANDGRGHWICRCGDNVVRSANGWAAHIASVLSGVYAITPLPEKPRRKYTAAYRAANGNIIPVGAENIRPEYVQTDLLEWRRDDPGGTYFIAYRDVPAWQEAPQ